MENKKILFVAPRFHTNQFFLTKNLLDNNIEIKFLSVYIGGSENHKYLTPTLSKPSVLVKWLLKGKKADNAEGRKFLRLYNITSFRQCYSLYKNFNPDIIIVRNLRFFTSMQHLIIGLMLRKKTFLYTLYGLHQKLDKKRLLAYRTLKALGIKHYTAVLGENNYPIVPNTLYIPMIFEKLINENEIISRRERKGIQILTIGKMMKRKNLPELISSLYRIDFFSDPNNKLIMISECISDSNFAFYEKIKQTITKYEDQIHVLLNVPHQEVFEIMKESDIFVMPAINEPAGTSMVEAMASGLGVICSDSNGAKYYIDEGQNGHVFEFTEDLENLDSAILQVLDKELLVRYGKKSLEIIETKHNVERFIELVVH